MKAFVSIASACAISLTLPLGAWAESTPALPSSYYLTSLGEVTPAKLQSPWDNCWAFAVASAIETSILKAEHNAAEGTEDAPATTETASETASTLTLDALSSDIDISEAGLSWFIHEPVDANGGTQKGEGYVRLNQDRTTQFSGGNFASIASMLVTRQGLLSEEVVPYRFKGFEDSDILWYSPEAQQQDWSIASDLRGDETLGWNVDGIILLPDPATFGLTEDGGIGYTGYNADATAAYKDAIMNVGGIAAMIDAELVTPADLLDASGWSSGKSEYFDYDHWSQYNAADLPTLNHAVTIVGWDDAYSADNFATKPPADGAWLCKNSWGSDDLYSNEGNADDAVHWGIDQTGFFWLSYYDHSLISGMAFEVANVEEGADNLYQYDYFGISEAETLPTYDDAEVANVFTAESTELLDGVGLWTLDADQYVEVTVYLLGDVTEPLTPNSFQMLLTEDAVIVQAKEAYPLGGYHFITFDEPTMIYEGEFFAIIVKTTGDADAQPVSYLMLERQSTDFNYLGDDFASTLIANDGETFVSVNGGANWETIDDFNTMEAESGAVYGNGLIKAYTTDTSLGTNHQINKIVKLEGNS